MTSLTTSSRSCAPRWATPATPGRANLAAGIAKTAAVLGFRVMPSRQRGVMPWQHDLNVVTTEMDESGAFVYRQVVIELPRQQGKSVDLLSMMVTRALRRPGTQISYTAQTRLDARHRLLDTWWPRIARSSIGPLVKPRKGAGSEALLFKNE